MCFYFAAHCRQIYKKLLKFQNFVRTNVSCIRDTIRLVRMSEGIPVTICNILEILWTYGDKIF